MRRAITIVTACAALAATTAKGEVVINVSQVGNSVEFVGSGTLNLTGLTYQESGSSGGDGAGIEANVAGLYSFGSNFDKYGGFTTSPSSFGMTGNVSGSGSGSIFGLVNSGLYLQPDFSYYGPSVAFTITLANQTFLSLGLQSGTYTWAWSGDSVSLVIPGSMAGSVPEPSSLVLLGTGLAGLLAYARRRRGTRSAA